MIVSAHADFRREDFLFPRTQSRGMRDTPWGDRVRPMRSWSELTGIGLVFCAASAALMLSASLI